MEYPRQLNLQTFEERQETDKWSVELVQKIHTLENLLEVSEKAHYRTLEQLRIASKALRELEIKSDKLYRGGNDWSLVEQLDFIKAKCQETLYQIEEMEKIE